MWYFFLKTSYCISGLYVASTVASCKVSGFSFCVMNKKEIQKEFISLCNVISLEEYVCCPTCNK